MIFVDENCVICGGYNDDTLLRLNDDDFFECPLCHAQYGFASIPLVALLPFRGKGSFRPGESRVPLDLQGFMLARSQPEQVVLADKNGIFTSRDEIQAYLAVVKD
ncbi:MAG: hypothetical protein KDK39_12100 [Leptospiraceae bacterium]|nr:hypothetical protein [Leptospiraceae bacterium]